MAKIAFLLGPQFEDSEMSQPYEAVREQGHEAVIIGLEQGVTLEGKKGKVSYTTDKAIRDADPNDYDAAVIPGGASPEKIRLDEDMKAFVRALDQWKKPIASICHGPQLLESAHLLKDRTITSVPGIKDDMLSAGAEWKDEEAVVDGNFITSRTPEDLPAFNRELLRAIDSYAAVRIN